MNKHEQILEPQSFLDYLNKNKLLPEVDGKKISELSITKEGTAVEYKKRGVVHYTNTEVRELKIDPEDLPIAVTYLGKGEENPFD